ncbi:MAG: NCS2 family permease, partial [Clostridiales bacterium]
MERFFKLSKFDTTMKTEILAGLTTFITMAYIIFVNPSILANAQGVTPDMIMALTIGTCLSAAFGSLMMGFYANLPFALAPGMGLNAFFAFTVATTLGYNGALGAIFISGILFMIITFLGWREAIVEAIPDNMKAAVEAGVGLFIAFIGLQNAGIVVADPDTFVAVGDFSTFAGAAPAIVSISGLLMLGILSKFKVKMALLLSIIFSTLLAFPLGLIEIPQFMNWSDLDLSRTFFQMDFKPLFALGSGSFWSSVLSILTIIIAFTLSDMFNALGTFISMEKYIDMPDKDGNRRSMTKAMMTDAAATTAGA